MEFIEQNLVVIAQATNQSISDCLWLIEDFFEHEVRKATLLCSCCIPRDFILFQRKRFAIKVADSNTFRANGDNFILAKFDSALGVIDKCCNIGCQEVLAFTKPATSGELRRTPTIVWGASAWIARRVNDPRRRRTAARMAAVRSPPCSLRSSDRR